MIEGFRQLVLKRLGGLGLAVLDARLSGEQTKSLVGSPSVGSPGKWGIKRAVGEIKSLAKEYAVAVCDWELLRRIEKAMAAKLDTTARRKATTATRAHVA